MKHQNHSPGSSKRKANLRVLTPVMAAVMAVFTQQAVSAPAPFKATAKFDKKSQKVIVSGAAKSFRENARVSVYDASNQTILYTANTNSKKTFSFSLLGANYVPCLVRVEVTNPDNNQVAKSLLTVSGAPKTTCSASTAIPACAIAAPANDTEIAVNGSVDFKAAAIKLKKGATANYT